MDKFREPEQFDAEVEIHGGEPFAVWAPAVNGSHVKKEQYFALLAELEAKNKRIAELEAEAKVWESATTKHLERAEEAEKRLATPVRLPDIRSDDYHETGWFQHMKYYRDVERSIRAAGFAVGDE
ncbi:hypothetical protein [Serratia marcescens]|uniref:hypothetical protein n=1 Tax=Serratia marcescens TaxID=615 RepID=UPI003F7CF0FA